MPVLESIAPVNRWRHAATGREAGAQLALGIVHEMNNLTGGIAVLSEIYQENAESGLPLAEGLDLILKSTHRLQTLVRHLKVINGPLHAGPTYFNVGECARALLDLFMPTLPKDVSVEVDFSGEELAACLDEATLRQALLHLTLNLRDAFEAFPEAEHRLRLSLRRLSETSAELVLAPGDGFGEDFRGTVPEDDPRWADAHARQLDAEQSLLELGGQLICRDDGAYVCILPLIA